MFLENRKGADELGASIPDFLDWKQQDRLCQQIVSLTPGQLTMTGGDQPEEVSSYYVSADAFALLGVQPRLGRPFTPEEDRAGSERVVILSHELWQSRFDGRQDLIGQSVKLDGEHGHCQRKGSAEVLAQCGTHRPIDQAGWQAVAATVGDGRGRDQIGGGSHLVRAELRGLRPVRAF